MTTKRFSFSHLFLAVTLAFAATGCFANGDDDGDDNVPVGSCAAETCDVDQSKVTCAAGQVPLTDETGCYTGTCIDPVACDVPPPCSSFNTEAQCEADTTCEAKFYGINCRDPQGQPCGAEGAQCVCEEFRFGLCATK